MLLRREKRVIAIALKLTLLATAAAVLFLPRIEFDLGAFAPGSLPLVSTVEAAEAPLP